MKAYEVIDAKVQERGITNAELSRRTGIDSELLRRSLIGARKIAADEFIVLCRELELNINSFNSVGSAPAV